MAAQRKPESGNGMGRMNDRHYRRRPQFNRQHSAVLESYERVMHEEPGTDQTPARELRTDQEMYYDGHGEYAPRDRGPLTVAFRR